MHNRLSMTVFPQHLLASLVPHMAFCRNQHHPFSTTPFGGITAILLDAGARKKATITSYPPTSLSCCPFESVRVAANDRISLQHLIGSLDLAAVGSPSLVLISSPNFAYTSLSSRVVTVRTPNRSILSNSRCRPCCTLAGSSSSPDHAPKCACGVRL